MTVYQQATQELQTVRDFLRFGESMLRRHQVTCGHGYAEPWDEVVAIVLHVLSLPPDSDIRVLDARLMACEKQEICRFLQQRIENYLPVAYLIHEAWFAGLLFKVNQDVLIPRSPIAELIEVQFKPWLAATVEQPKILDLGTGSGCIAISCAVHLPNATVIATDISDAALAVAKQNIAHHEVDDRVQLVQSDLWAGLSQQTFDIILSNPPYVAPNEYVQLPKEFQHEPKLGLYATDEGLAVVMEILRHAYSFLNDQGILIVEVGSAEYALKQRYPELPFYWLSFERGGEGVFLLSKADLGLINGWK